MNPFFLEPQLSIRRTLPREGSKRDFPAPHGSLKQVTASSQDFGWGIWKQFAFPTLAAWMEGRESSCDYPEAGRATGMPFSRLCWQWLKPQLLHEAPVTFHCATQAAPSRCPCTDTLFRKLSKAEGVFHNCVFWNQMEVKDWEALPCPYNLTNWKDNAASCWLI